MSAAEVPPVLHEWRPLSRVLADHARERPTQVAIADVDRGEHVTFGQLATTVDGVAAQLASRGVMHGDRVVLFLDDGIETLTVWFALWRLGAVICPFDISQVGARSTQAALQTLQPSLLLHGRRISGSELPPGEAPVARFAPWQSRPPDADIHVVPDGPGLSGIDGADLRDVAAACCTSGSSGRMKIVLHDHQSYWLNGEASAQLLGLGATDRMLEFRSFSWYSPQILSLMPMIQRGLSLYVAGQFSRTRWVSWVKRYGISVAVGVPAVLDILLSDPPPHLRDAAAFLRLMSSSSAPLPASTWERFERETGIPLVNLYGSSEGGWICGNRLGDRRIGTVGRPAPGMQLRIVAPDGRPCEQGKPGEIVISGAKLALGTLENGGWLRPIRGTDFATRDFAVDVGDGYLQLLGRMDDIIIRGGVKVSPAEVEEVMTTHDAVAEAAAVGVPDLIYGQEVVCFVTVRPGRDVPADELREHAQRLLSRDKRPKAVEIIDTLPRSARGKVRRDALLARWLDRAVGDN